MTDHHAHVRKMQWGSMMWLTEHALLGEAYWDEGRGARWCIGRPHTFIHRCEVIAGIGGSLIVHGDFDTARFAHYGDHADAWSRLRWMADCTDLDYYVAQKAAIGAGGDREGVMEYVPRLAKQELRERADEWERDGYDARAVALLRGAAQTHTEYEHELRTFLGENDKGWDLWEHEFGKVPASHVVVSHLALNKCAALLRERHGAEGPPECRR
jgi:hypothetical protein